MAHASRDNLTTGVFGAVLSPPRRARRRACALVLLAAALHALPALAVLALTRPSRAGSVAPGPELTFLSVRPASGPAAVEPTAADARRLGTRPPRPPSPRAEAPTPAPADDTLGEGWSVEVAPGLDTSGVGAATAATGPGLVAGAARGLLGGAGEGARIQHLLPVLSEAERGASLDAYVAALIRQHFRDVDYPHLAAAAGIEGHVTLRATLDARGRVLALAREGRCPHPVLCEAAEAAVRRASPLPPPPPELGSPLTVELPFRYFIR